jgi:pescadillo protein
MLTFLEFYQALMKFINFKLFTDLGMAYPVQSDYMKGTHLDVQSVKEL